jgi:hypothetical protein
MKSNLVWLWRRDRCRGQCGRFPAIFDGIRLAQRRGFGSTKRTETRICRILAERAHAPVGLALTDRPESDQVLILPLPPAVPVLSFISLGSGAETVAATFGSRVAPSDAKARFIWTPRGNQKSVDKATIS